MPVTLHPMALGVHGPRSDPEGPGIEFFNLIENLNKIEKIFNPD